MKSKWTWVIVIAVVVAFLLLSTGNVGKGSFLTFSTVDINGNMVNMSDYKDAKVIMLNFWEPWCGPCVGEMPSLEKLYEKYKDQGLVIIGAYSTGGQDNQVRGVMQKCNTSYPIVKATKSMEPFMTQYVPTTMFFDGNGHALIKEPIVGSMDYASWEYKIQKLLNK